MALTIIQLASRMLFSSKRVAEPVILKGAGSVLSLGENICSLGYKSVFIASSKTVLKRGMLDKLLSYFESKGIRAVTFIDMVNDPTIENVEGGFKVYKENNCDCILAVGGGSVLDCAKAISLKVSNPSLSVRAISFYLMPLKEGAPIFAVPTTSGTGSEITYFSVITDEKNQKKSAIVSDKFMPRQIAFDTELLKTVPQMATAYAGMDALTHAIEAFISRFRPAFKEDCELSPVACRGIFENLLIAFNEPENEQARLKMAEASYFAGIAFRRASVGFVHAIAHRLGEKYHIPHGLACALVLPKVLEKSMPEISRDLAILARECGIEGSDDIALSNAFIRKIKDLNEGLGIRPCFKPEKADYPLIIKRSVAEGKLQGAPVVLTKEQISEILDEFLE